MPVLLSETLRKSASLMGALPLKIGVDTLFLQPLRHFQTNGTMFDYSSS